MKAAINRSLQNDPREYLFGLNSRNMFNNILTKSLGIGLEGLLLAYPVFHVVPYRLGVTAQVRSPNYAQVQS